MADDELVILLDSAHQELGIDEKLRVHREGKRHRGFAVLVFNYNENLLIQQRAKTKYHSGGLWSCTVDGHPRPNESEIQAAHRRLLEEMGFDCELRELLRLGYKASLDNGLIENEYGGVFIGRFEKQPIPNPEEVSDYKWASLDEIRQDVSKNPDNYTVWFRLILPRI